MTTPERPSDNGLSTPAPASATSSARWSDRLLRRAVDYVPLLLALLLALGTFWLVRSMPKIRPAEPPPPADVPD